MLTRRTLVAATAAMAFPGAIDAKKRKKPKAKTKLKLDETIPLLRDLAMHHQHGWAEEGTPIPELVARYRAGEILKVLCGPISRVGVQVLHDAGFPARTCGVVTQLPFDGNDGHVMLEVWDQGAWRLYCVDGNRRAVDSRGRGINLVAQVAAGTGRLWEPIADDLRVAPEEPGATTWTPEAQEVLDNRVFGTPWIQTPEGGGAFHDDTDRARLEGTVGHTYVGKKEWQRLLGKP